jgi:putative transcriptional regulator
MKSKSKKVASFRTQMAKSMAELESIMSSGQSLSGNGRFTIRTIYVQQPRTYTSKNVRAVRQQLGVSQAIFAQLLGVSQVLVRSWERGARAPAPVACRLLDIVRDNPQMVASLIHGNGAESINSLGKPPKNRSLAARRRASAA